MIGVIDCGMGNVRAFLHIYKRLNIPARPVDHKSVFDSVDKLVLPGVGTFDWAMHRLEQSGLLPALERAVLNVGKPVLGVCIGMHLMASRSDEGQRHGLGWISVRVRKFALPDRARFPLPHMGWNEVVPVLQDGLFRRFTNSGWFYFLHSYHFPTEGDYVLATTEYGGMPFASAVRVGNIYGVQFHPEKSHADGIRLLRNFAEL